MSFSATWTVSFIFPHSASKIASPTKSQKFWWAYILYIQTYNIYLHRVLMWHIYSQTFCGCRKAHTWGQIYISSLSKIITPLTDLSDPHISPSFLQFLMWLDVWIMWCNVCILSGETSLCLLSHRVTPGEMMTDVPCSAEGPNKRRAASAPRTLCNINHVISRSAGICIRDFCLMNESFPLICLSKHIVSKGWIAQHIKHRQEYAERGKT